MSAKINQLKSGRTKNAEAHTAPTKYGMGDYYGTGVRAKMGRERGTASGVNYTVPIPKSKLKIPPKNLA